MRSSTSPSADRRGPSRRALIGTATSFLFVAARGDALAQRVGPYRRIIVDVAPLQAKGLGGYALVVKAAVERAAATAFAGAVAPGRGLPELVIEVTGVSLSAYVGSGNPRLDSGGVSSDYMEGRLITQAGGRTIASLPMLSALPASSGGAWYAPDNERRRLQALADHFAWWSRRKLET